MPTRRPSAATTLVLLASVALVGAQSFVVSPLVPDVAGDLGTGPGVVGQAVAAYGAATAVSALVGGRFVDRWPRRRALRAAVLVLGAGLLVTATAQHPLWLAAGEAVMGAAAGVLLPVAYATAGESAPAGEATRVLGRVLAGWSLAMVVAAPAGAVLSPLVGWRGVFVALAVLAAAVALGVGLLPEHGRRTPDGGTPGYRVVLRRPGVLPLLLVVTAFMATFYGVFTYLGTELREARGAGVALAGGVVLAYGLGFGAAVLVDGLLDRGLGRLGPRRVLVVLLGGQAALVGALTASTASPAPLVVVAVLWGVVNHAGLGLLVGLLLARADGAGGAAMALNSGVTYAAAAVGTAAGGWLFELHGFTVVGAAAVVALLLAVVPAVRVR